MKIKQICQWYPDKELQKKITAIAGRSNGYDADLLLTYFDGYDIMFTRRAEGYRMWIDLPGKKFTTR